MFSASSETAAASRRRSISIETERASVSTTSSGFRRRASARGARRGGRRRAWPGGRARNLLAHAGAHHLHGDRLARPRVRMRGLVDLGDGGGGDRLAELREERRRSDAERDLDHARPPRPRGKGGMRSCRRSRSRAPRRRRCRAASPGTGRTSRRTGRAGSAPPRGAPRRRRRPAARSAARARSAKRGRGRQRARIDERQRALARQHEAGAQVAGEMDEARRSRPDLPAGMDGDDARREGRWVTRLKPASSIIRAKAAGREAADRFDEIAVGLGVARHHPPSRGITLNE